MGVEVTLGAATAISATVFGIAAMSLFNNRIASALGIVLAGAIVVMFGIMSMANSDGCLIYPVGTLGSIIFIASGIAASVGLLYVVKLRG